VVLAGVNLLLEPRDAGIVGPDDDEQILGVESQLRVMDDDLNVGEALGIRRDLILALHNEDAILFQNAVGLSAGLEIHIQHGIMPLRTRGCFLTVRVRGPEGAMRAGARQVPVVPPVQTFHVRRV
jgi:hypothetical protein